MDILENIKKVIQDLVLPELETIKGENREIKTILTFTNQRIDDVNLHLVEQSRRIDEINKRIDETNKRIDGLEHSLNARIDALYRVVVRREEFEKLELKMMEFEHELNEVNRKIAA